MKERRWITAAAARAIHAELIAEHGGAAGLRDASVLEATRRRRSLVASAAAYGGAFASRNKPMALAAIDVFLQLNGYELAASEEDAAATMWALAEGRLSERELAGWVKKWTISG